MSESAHYQVLRSHGDVHKFVLCYADHFYANVPYDVPLSNSVEECIS